MYVFDTTPNSDNNIVDINESATFTLQATLKANFSEDIIVYL